MAALRLTTSANVVISAELLGGVETSPAYGGCCGILSPVVG